MTRLAFVTLHYKNLDDTLGLLESLSHSQIPTGAEVSLYVVDNEGSGELAKEIKKYRNAVLLVSGKNLGFVGGNNLGFEKAIHDGNEIIVTINNDTYVGKDFIKQILNSPITDPLVGAVGGLIYFAPGFEFKKDYSKKTSVRLSGMLVGLLTGIMSWDPTLMSTKLITANSRKS